jgi:hypothetical protein
MKRSALFLSALPLLAFAAGCRTTTTLPRLSGTNDPIESITLYIPEEMEVKSIDFSATMYGDQTQGTTQSAGGRAFVKVYAVHKRTGEQYLLIYENIEKRPQPVMMIRFEPRSASGMGR